MEGYVITKVLNNNVVIAKRNREEFVLVGKAIGFDAGKGKKINGNRIETVFIRQGTEKNNFDRVLQNIDSDIIGVSEEIISLCERELKSKLNEAIHISLPDHINFAFLRIKKGIKIENPFLNELKVLYPKEYKLSEKAIYMINSRFETKLPEDEIGFICMHIKAGINQEKVSDALAYTKKIGEIMDLISKLLKKDIDKSSFEYMRTLTHLNFVIDRIINKKTVRNYLLDSIKKELYNEYDIAIKIAMKIENLFSVKVPEDEIGFIALHLERLREI